MDAEAASNLPHVVLSVGHERAGHREIAGRELRPAPSETPTGACSLEPCPRALPNQVALKLSQGGKDVEDEPAGRRVRLDAFGQGNEPHSPPLQVTHNPNQVGQRAAEAVEPPDHQDIPRAQRLEAAFELGPAS